MELHQLVDVRVEESSRPFHKEVATLKLLLGMCWCFFWTRGTCPSDGLGLANIQAPVALDSSEQLSSVAEVIEEEHLYCCFSPRG
jgi:hypothetical protein